MPALGFWTVVTADLDDTLEVDVHAVGELEGLEVGEADHRSARAEVLYLLEPVTRESHELYKKEHQSYGLNY